MEQLTLPQEISDVVQGIVKQFDPARIYLFSNKRGPKGKTAGFKLCIIMNCINRDESAREIYRSIDSEVPFDIVLYTPHEWKKLTNTKGSFAQKIYSTGVLVHE